MMENCTRHAFTDGECVHSGCVNCPGRAELRIIHLREISRATQWRFALFPATIAMLAVLALVAFIAPERFCAVVAENQEMAR